jgi:hypothetical protein
MRFLAASLLVGIVLSAPTTPPTSTEVTPFYLQVSSATNATLNSMSLFACHVGAAIEKLCIDKTTTVMSKPPSFGLNTTYYASRGMEGGNLIYNMPYNDKQHLWAGSGLGSKSGVAIVWFEPSPASDSEQYPMGFDKEGVMKLGGKEEWQVCRDSTNGSYHYEVLAWVYGGGPAKHEGEECHPVTVRKVDPSAK